MKPRFAASDVASLLGLNPYRSKNESLLKVLTAMPKFKSVILGVKDTMGARTEREVVAQASGPALQAMWASVDMACGATSDYQIEKAITTFKQTHIRQVVQETLEGKRAPTTPALQEAVARVISGQMDVATETALLCVNPEVTLKIEQTQEHQVLASEIQKRRGTRLEDKAENEHAVSTGVQVTDRNTFVEFESDSYRLIGYLDGMQGDKVVETKNRKRFWTTPPAYDFIQLRCYMFMKGEKDGVLLENFPGRPPRTTEVPWDDERWMDIHAGLCGVARTIANITEEDVQSLAQSVFATMKS
uniref:Uncharacterized protein n=1 Tax=viral metagenome TaxID=1070528 RepID=A0A6C0B661_9ZZZZ